MTETPVLNRRELAPPPQQMLELGEAGRAGVANKTLRDQFLVLPFSVMHVMAEEHLDRRREWEALGIEPETFIGRDDNLLNFPANMRDGSFYEKKAVAEAALGRSLSTREFLESGLYEQSERAGSIERSTSIFDPVLAEAAYRWWCPPGGRVYDPFAGGACRGIVASVLERPYTGVELRGEQVVANRRQAMSIFGPRGRYGRRHPAGGVVERPRWLEGDARQPPEEVGRGYDFVFSCPPYADLERYSDDPRDLSQMGWEEFLEGYENAIADACSRLLPNRFAAFVVGEVRKPPPGLYRGLVQETIRIFDEEHLGYYNEVILATSVGTAPRRVGRYLRGSGKIARVHQTLLVFVKGDPREAAALCTPMAA
jgi:hypothetical protein